MPNLIGGSADLSGSNNTKTHKHKIIKPNNDFCEERTIERRGTNNLK